MNTDFAVRDHRLTRPRPLPSFRKPLGIVPSAFCLRLVSHFIRLGSPRSSRQSGRNRSSYSPKPITRGTQTLHKGRSEIAQGELKPLTRGANQIHNRRSDGKPVLPAAPFRRSDRKIRPTRTIHFVLPTLSFKATDFLTIPTDFFFSAYGVIRTNHTAPDPPDFRIFAAPPRSAAHSPRHSALYLAPIRPRGGSSRNSALCLDCRIGTPHPTLRTPNAKVPMERSIGT